MRSFPLGEFALYLVFAAIYCLLNLGGSRLVSMEPMVINGARHMLEEGGWAVPHLYGEMFTFKPPLANWMSAAVLALVDEPSELLLRLPFALSAVTFGALTFLLVSRVSGRFALLAAMASIGSAHFVQKVRIAQYDTPLAAFVGIAVVASIVALTNDRGRMSLWVLAYFSLTLGFLAKGSPALMSFLPGLLLAAWWSGSARRLLSLEHAVGATTALLLTSAYLFWAFQTGGSDVFLQPLAEVRERGVSWDLSRVLATLSKPVVIWGCFLPWSLGLLLWRPFRRIATDVQKKRARAALGFVVGGVSAFVVVSAHETRYYLPLAASFGLLSAVVLDALYTSRIQRVWILGSRVLFLLVLAALLFLASSRGVTFWPVLAVAAPILTLMAFSGSSRLENETPENHTRSEHNRGAAFTHAVAATSLLCAFGQALILSPTHAAKRDLFVAAQHLAMSVPAQEAVWLFGPADCAGRVGPLLHYMERDVRTLDSPGSPRPGSLLLLVDRQHEYLPTALEYQVVDSVRTPRFDLTLIRTGQDDQPPALKPNPNGSTLVGDLCGTRYLEPEDPEVALDYYLNGKGKRSSFIEEPPVASSGG